MERGKRGHWGRSANRSKVCLWRGVYSSVPRSARPGGVLGQGELTSHSVWERETQGSCLLQTVRAGYAGSNLRRSVGRTIEHAVRVVTSAGRVSTFALLLSRLLFCTLLENFPHKIGGL